MTPWHRLTVAAAVFAAVPPRELGVVSGPIRARSRMRVADPNAKPASATIRGAATRNRETFAETTVPAPLTADLGAAAEGLRRGLSADRDAYVLVSARDAVERLECGPRLRTRRRLGAPGVRE